MNDERYWSGKRRTERSPYWEMLTRPERRNRFCELIVEWQRAFGIEP
jgi:hypothetical protein